MVCGLFMLLLMLTMPLAAPNSIALKRCTGAQECQRRTKGMTWKSNYLTLKTQTPDGHNPNTTLAARSPEGHATRLQTRRTGDFLTIVNSTTTGIRARAARTLYTLPLKGGSSIPMSSSMVRTLRLRYTIESLLSLSASPLNSPLNVDRLHAQIFPIIPTRRTIATSVWTFPTPPRAS